MIAAKTCLEAALEYAARGWPVLPLHTPVGTGCSCGWRPGGEDARHGVGKHPRLEHGVSEASTDERRIRGWWAKWPDANVGIATTECLVLDVDGFAGEVSLDDVEEAHGPLPPTLEVRTGGGGRHLMYRPPAGEPIKNRVSAAPKLDVRSKGGYVVAAPSLHASGARYEWVDPDVALADLGDHGIVALLRAVKRPAAGSAKPLPPAPRVEGRGTDRDLARARGILRAACDRIAGLTDGRRAAVLEQAHKMGGYLWTGLDFSEAELALLEAGRRSGTRYPLVREVRYGLETGSASPLALPPDDSPPRVQGGQGRRDLEPPIEVYEDEASAHASPRGMDDASSPARDDAPKRTRPAVLGRLERVLEVCQLGDADTRVEQIATLHGEVDELAAAWAEHETEIRAAFTRLRVGRGSATPVNEILRLIVKGVERLKPSRSGAVLTALDIRLGPDIHRVEEEAIGAMAARDDGVFQRAGQLVQVVEDRLCPVDKWHLRARLSEVARFMATRSDGVVAHVAVPLDLVQGVLARRVWPGVRPIAAVVHEPILRPDGTILQVEGYDRATETIYQPTQAWPQVPSAPTLEDAQESAARLFDVVSSFPVASSATSAAWLAAVLTPLARFSFSGPSPWFLWTANVRGTGKSLMASVAAIIATGSDPAAYSAPERDEEMRKLITSCVMASRRVVLLDNLVGDIGWPSLDAVLTTNRHGDRVLGSSTQIDLPMTTCWYGTGNSPVFRADTSRRVLPIPLDSATPNPEHRRFRVRDLRAFCLANRPALTVDALTILRAFCRAGRPSQDLAPWGSYEGWSALVRGAIVWLGYPDPAETAADIGQIDLGQVEIERLAAAVWAWRRDAWWSVSELQAELATDHMGALQDLDAAVCDLTDNDKISARKLGKRLIRLRDRMVTVDSVILRFETRKNKHSKSAEYRVVAR